MALRYRLARPTDIPTLITINIDGEQEYRVYNTKLFRQLVGDRQVLVAVEHGSVVGLLYWRPEFLGRNGQWYLKQITVARAARRRGVGGGLLRTFLAVAKKKKVKKVFADIHNDNYASLRLCLGAGGLISGTVEGVGDTPRKDERVIIRFEL